MFWHAEKKGKIHSRAEKVGKLHLHAYRLSAMKDRVIFALTQPDRFRTIPHNFPVLD
jgi:hypothetical protein